MEKKDGLKPCQRCCVMKNKANKRRVRIIRARMASVVASTKWRSESIDNRKAP
jgi:hypothetical protein